MIFPTLLSLRKGMVKYMNNYTSSSQNRASSETEKNYYPARVRFSKLSLFSTITIKPFWIVPFCLISGFLLLGLRGFVLASEKFYHVFNPLIIPLFLIGLGLIVLRRVLYRNPNPWLNVANTAGYVFFYFSLFLIFFLSCGLIALWALPFDMISAETYRPEYMAAFAHNPAAISVYENYIETVSNFKLLRFDDGISGLILHFKDYMIELVKNEELSLVSRIASALVTLLAAFFLIVLTALVFPGVSLLLPFALAYLCCTIVDWLLRIGLENPFATLTNNIFRILDKFTKKGKE